MSHVNTRLKGKIGLAIEIEDRGQRFLKKETNLIYRLTLFLPGIVRNNLKDTKLKGKVYNF